MSDLRAINTGRAALLCFSALALAACSESSTNPSRELSPSVANADQWPELNSPNADKHVMHVKGWQDNNGNANGLDNGNAGNAHGRPGSGGTNNGISFHGGPVLQSGTNVAAVYWSGSTIFNGGPAAGSNGAGSADGSLVGYFMSNLGSSDYFKINTTYTDGSKAIAAIVNYTQYWANNSFNVPANGSKPSDADMLAMLEWGFNNGKLTYDSKTLYAIFTPSGVNLGGGFGSQYCAYHWYGTVNVGGVAKTVLYAAMPYNQQYPSACSMNSAPNGDLAADAEVNTLAHEIEETTTDLLGTAWFDTRGYENADKCAWTFGSTSNNGSGTWNITVGAKQFLVQQNWVNASGGYCAKSL